MGFEIERKYLISMPDTAILSQIKGAYRVQIEQTYLIPEIPGSTDRVRKSLRDGKAEYTHTVKIKLSPQKRIENEEIISEEEYLNLLRRKDTTLNVIKKDRWKIPLKNLTAEIDIFPFWKKQAYCEVETTEENEHYTFPDFIKVIREVTEDGAYSNRSLSAQIPPEN